MIENWEQYKDLEYYPDRVCACGCGGRIKVKLCHCSSDIPRYIFNHNKRKHTPSEIRSCKCGCRETFECLVTSKQRFINGHNSRKSHPFDLEVEAILSGKKEAPFCKCGCGRRIVVKPHHRSYGIPDFIRGHHKRGWVPSEETKAKLREANLGRVDSKERRLKNSEARKGDKNVSKRPEVRKKQSEAKKRNWQDPEYVRKILKTSLPNKPEKFLTNLFQGLFPSEYKYVGNGQFALAGKNPDFINTNGQKKIIELFGDYWHGEERTGIPNEQHEQERIDVFAKEGYQTLIIWEHELSDVESLIEKIEEFHFMYQEVLV